MKGGRRFIITSLVFTVKITVFKHATSMCHVVIMYFKYINQKFKGLGMCEALGLIPSVIK